MNPIVSPAAQKHHSGVAHKNLALRDVPFDTLTLHYGDQFKGDMVCDKTSCIVFADPFQCRAARS